MPFLFQHEPSFYSDITSFECLPCAEGCDVCEDASPCVAELNWPMRTSILVLACAVIGFLPPAAAFTFRYQQVKVSALCCRANKIARCLEGGCHFKLSLKKGEKSTRRCLARRKIEIFSLFLFYSLFFGKKSRNEI